MAKWTEGEWTMGSVEEECGEARISIYASNGKLIADVWLINPDSTVTPEEGEANAELMTAAPDMYEACKRALPILSALVNEKKLRPEECGYETSGYETLQLVKNAILKAEGREPDATPKV